MEYILLIFIILYMSSCQKGKEESIIPSNLYELSNDIKYSQLIKSLDYITLNLGDTCLLSGIQKIYFDDDTIIVQDKKREGICIFTHNGKFIKQINYIGEGLAEYHNANTITVDTISNHIYIYDATNFKINQYTYLGEFIKSDKVEYFMKDFAITAEGYNIMFQPYRSKTYKKNGVWICSSNNKFIKQLIEHESNNQEFEFISTLYNETFDGIYYYDRNNDNIYLINADSTKLLYTINLKQKIPEKVRNIANPSSIELEGHSMMYDFCISSKYIIFTYFIFGENENPFRWVFSDRKTKTNIVCKNFENDFDEMKSSNYRLFYLNDSTWCRVVDRHEKDCNTLLQIMHLK